jgi:hypothetical protein
MTQQQRELFLTKPNELIKVFLLKSYAMCIKQKSKQAYKQTRHFAIIACNRGMIDSAGFQTIMTNAKQGLVEVMG